MSLGVALWSLGTLPFLTRLFRGRTSRDLEHYMLSANALLDGQRIYVDVPFEYPPYVLAWLAGPAMLAGDVAQFRWFFGLLILCMDALVKAALIWTGFRDRHRPPDALPFVMYTLATAAVGHILLQRYDVIPAALSVAAVIALSAGWAGVAGLMAAVAVGTKVYPAVFVPVLAVVAWRRSRAMQSGSRSAWSPVCCRSSPCRGQCHGGVSRPFIPGVAWKPNRCGHRRSGCLTSSACPRRGNW